MKIRQKEKPVEREVFEDEFLDEIDSVVTTNRSNNKYSAWIISLFVHAIVIFSMLYILLPNEVKQLDVIITTSPILPEEDLEEEEKEIEIVKEKVEVEVEVEVELPPMITEEVVEDQNETENEMEAESAEGVSEAISDTPFVGNGVMGNIGGGGGGGGAFGQRSGGGKKRALLKGGGSKKTESSVDLGLWWLATHQEKDGHWDNKKYEGDGMARTDTAITGTSLLAFLGAGHTDKVGKYRKNVKTAVRWLLDKQEANGSFGKQNYVNGICTMAIAESAGMGIGGIEVIKATEKAVDYLLDQQNPTGGWDYQKHKGVNDISLTGWCVMGLKSAMVSGIRDKEVIVAFEKVKQLMDSKKKTTGDNTSTTKGFSWYRDKNGTEQDGTLGCGAIAMLLRQYLGWHRSEPWLIAAGQRQVGWSMPKDIKQLDVYRTYYAYLALFQQGGKNWKTFNKHVGAVILKGQRQDGDFKGSWDATKGGQVNRGGRVLATSMLVLSLEVYYRYKSVMD